MHRTSALLAIALGSIAAASCLQTSTVLNPNYCGGAQDGDTFCAETYPDGSLPYCLQGVPECTQGREGDGFDGCVAERPADECYSPCGRGNSLLEDDSCVEEETTVADATSTGETEGSTTDESETGSGTEDATTTGGAGCMGHEECVDPLAPFCDGDGECMACDGMPDGDAACAELDAGAPVCDAGVCVQCTGERDEACEGMTPVCGAGNVCVGCTEHAECPESACHLDGEQAGACFDVADVVNVANTGELTAALSGLDAEDSVVVRLGGGNYTVTVDVGVGEVAILGSGDPVLSGDGSRAVDVFGDGLVYLAGVEVVNGSGDGIACSGSAVWVDDAEVRNNAQVGVDVSGGCDAHLRRSAVRVNAEGGIDQTNGALSLVNSVVAGNGGTFSAFGGISLDGVEVFVTYSTIAGNDSQNAGMSFRCNGTNSGVVRNSIAVGADSASVDCSGPAFESNAVDESGLGGTNQMVGAFEAGWFANPGAGDFSLTTSGETEFMDIAQWTEGDPISDADGGPIPTEMPSFPGYDQP